MHNKLKLPQLRRPELFSIGEHGYALMRLDDLDLVLKGGASLSFSLRERRPQDKVEDELRRQVFQEA